MQRHKGVETMTDETIKQILKFRDERNWKQFHNPKDLAISISLDEYSWCPKSEFRQNGNQSSVRRKSPLFCLITYNLGIDKLSMPCRISGA